MKLKKCIFCNKVISGDKSNEHIIPAWLLEHLQIKKLEIQPTHTNWEGEVISERNHTLNNFLAGSICSTCNNGWMSELESHCKERLISLIDGQANIEDLTLEDRFDLARWAFKTAICLNYGSNFHSNVPKKHFRQLFLNHNTLPKRVSIFARTHKPTRPFYWIQSATWMINGREPKESLKKLLASKSYKIGLQFGNLLFHVGYLPNNNMTNIIRKGYHIPFWPRRGKVAWINELPELQETSEDELFRFHLTLELGNKM